MKRFVNILICTLVGVSFPLQGAKADVLRSWKWPRYGMRFKLPRTWTVTKSDATVFIAKGDGIVMKIRPWQEDVTTALKAANQAFRSYRIIESPHILDRKYLSRGDTGLTRYMIYGKGRYRGKAVRFGILGIRRYPAQTTFYLRMWWFKENKKAKKLSYAIATSFRAYQPGDTKTWSK